MLWCLNLCIFFLAVYCDHSFPSLLLYFFQIVKNFQPFLSSEFLTFSCFYATSCLIAPDLSLFWNVLPIPYVTIFIVRLSNVPFSSFSSLHSLLHFLLLLHACFAYYISVCVLLLLPLRHHPSIFLGESGKLREWKKQEESFVSAISFFSTLTMFFCVFNDHA